MQTIARREKTWEFIALAVALLGAMLMRGWIFATGRASLDADECYLAIQGLDILHGSPQIFFYGQNYMGCIEAYGFALFRLLIPSSTPLTVQVQAAAQTLVYLVTSYLLVRRFFGRQVALVTLFLLAFPPNLLALWLGKIRGYLPWLILGNGILYLLFLLEQEKDPARLRTRFGLLGLLLGIAWWANPLSLYYCVTVFALALFVPGLRRVVWAGGLGSAPALFVNGSAVAILAILESRALVGAPRSALLHALFQYRLLFLAASGVLGLLAAGVARARRGHNYNLAAMCLGFAAGNAPALWVYWTVASLNLKQRPDTLVNVLNKMILTPMFEFPLLAGLIDPSNSLETPLFGLAVNLFVVTVYLCALYCAVRSVRRAGAPLAGMLVLSVATLLLFWMSNNPLVGQERYLLCLYLPMFVFMGLLIKDLNEKIRGLGIVVLGLMLAIHLASVERIKPTAVTLPSGVSAEERSILAYTKAHRWGEVLIDTSDEQALRLTLFSEQQTVFLDPKGYSNRIERHKRIFGDRSDYPLICTAGNRLMETGRQPTNRFERFEVYDRVPKNLIITLYGDLFLK